MTTKTLQLESFKLARASVAWRHSKLIRLIADAIYEASIRRVLRGIVRAA